MNRRLVARASALAALVPLLFAAAVAADRLVLRNGDAITGTVRFLERMVEVKPDYSDRILIEKSQVESVEYSRPDHPATLDELGDESLAELVRTAPGEAEYPDAGVVYLLYETATEVQRDGSFVDTTRSVAKVLKERGKSIANRTVSTYRDKATAEVLVARSIKPDGRLFHVKPDSIKVTAQYNQYPLYDRADILQYTIPEVKEGDIVETVVRTTTKRVGIVDVPGCSVFFRGAEPQLRTRVAFRMPDRVDGAARLPFKHALFNFPGGDTPEVEVSREQGGYSFHVEYGRADGMIHEDNRPPLRDLVPRLKAQVATTHREVAREALHRLKKVAQPTDATKRLAKELGDGAASPREHARRIYEFVAFRVKVAGVPFLITDLVPTPPDRTLTEKYGGEVDRVSLLYTLLVSAGFKPEFLLVRERGIGDLDHEVPSLHDFQGLVLRVKIDGETFWLAQPSEFRPFGVLPAAYQDTLALPLSAENGALVRTPEAPGEPDLTRVRIDVTLAANGDGEFAEHDTYLGNEGAGMRSGYKRVKPVEWERSLRTGIEAEVKNSRLIGYEVADMNDLSRTAEVTARYAAERFADAPGEGKYLVFKLPFISKASGFVAKPERVYDLDLPYTSESEREYLFRLPDGYEPYHLPGDLKFSHPLLEYERLFAFSPGERTLRFTERHRTGGGRLERALYPEFKGMVDTLAAIDREWIVLVRSGK